MPSAHEFRCDVPGGDAFARLLGEPLPKDLRAGIPARSFHRDVYLDTPDEALHRKDAFCRLRLRADDRRILTFSFRAGTANELQRFDAEVKELDPRGALQGDSEPARRLRALVDPALLRPYVELETERVVRTGQGGVLLGSRFDFVYDSCAVRAAGLNRSFQELKVRRLRAGRPTMEEIESALENRYGLTLILAPKLLRARKLFSTLESEALARAVGTGHAIAILATEEGRVAFLPKPDGHGLSLPVSQGSGDEACRRLLKDTFGSAVSELRLLGTVPGTATRPALEVWIAERLRKTADTPSDSSIVWLSWEEAFRRAGSPALQDPDTLAALGVASRSQLPTGVPSGTPRPPVAHPAITAFTEPVRDGNGEKAPLLDSELSQLEFNQRVLEMAEDAAVPLLERFSYLAIVSANLDEFFMVRVGGLKQAAGEVERERSPDMAPRELLNLVGIRVRQMGARQQAAVRACLRQLATQGVRVLAWEALPPAAQQALRQSFREQIYPLLTPRAVTMSPGHPFPLIPSLALSFALLLQDMQTGPAHIATLKVPATLPRFVAVPGTRDLLPVEELVRANLATLYPDRSVQRAALFRVTRSGDLDLDDEAAGDFLQAIEEDSRSRAHNPVVRIEVERSMPRPVRDLLLRELQFERGSGGASAVSEADVYEVDGLMDLGALRELASRVVPENVPREALLFPPFHPRHPFEALPRGEGREAGDPEDLWEALRQADRLVHHPYDDFADTVLRFFASAARDPKVLAMKVTLYRAGDRSPIVESLLQAAAAGKEVAAFVELKARFDEERNVTWAKRLEEAGVHVIYGLVGLKNHAKVAMVVRSEEGGLRRYVHIGTGNYNAQTARFYTDFGLFSADVELGEDVGGFFNELTGSSHAPKAPFQRLLVAPRTLLPGLLSRIEREADNARAGLPARIFVKLNGVADSEVVRALYEASRAGVEVRLIVRGLCTLQPGVPGISERIRVISVLGRFLEHARVYVFANGSAENGPESEIFIGSADLRPRNLRRRVEVLTPIGEPALKLRLAHLLEEEWNDPTAWELASHGAYLRRPFDGLERPRSAQDRLAAELA